MQQMAQEIQPITSIPHAVLLTVSGTIPQDVAADVARGRRPQADYLEMIQAFGADLIDHAEARQTSGWVGRVLERIGGPHLVLAWACFRRRHRYRVIVSDGEQVGIPFALMCKLVGLVDNQRPRHLMIVHILSVRKKLLAFDLFAIQSHIDRMFVYSSWQKQFIERRLKLPPERVILTPFMVDARFFSLDQVSVQPRKRPLISSAGLEHRDYPTLVQAVRDLDVQVAIAAASPWSKQSDKTSSTTLPDNVEVRKFSQYDLRQLYADSQFVVVPLYPVEFQAGVTTILEAMAMGRAVICSRTPGQTDVVVDGETGIYVPPGDPQALRSAIVYLLEHPEEAARMGRAGRVRVERLMNLDYYVNLLNTFVQKALQDAAASSNRYRSLRMVYQYGLKLGTQLLLQGRVRQSLPYLIRPVNYWRTIEYQLVLEAAEFKPEDRILDIGSPKLLSLYLAKTLGAKIVATDVDDYFIKNYAFVRSMERIAPEQLHIAVEDGRALGFPDGFFTKIFSISVLEHIPDEGDIECAREIARVLAPGGRCCLTVPFAPVSRDEYLDTDKFYWSSHSQAGNQGKVFFQRRYSEDDLFKRLIEPSGLHLAKLRYVGETVLTSSQRELSDYLPVFTGPVQPVISRMFHTRPVESWRELAKPLCALIVLEKR